MFVTSLVMSVISPGPLTKHPLQLVTQHTHSEYKGHTITSAAPTSICHTQTDRHTLKTFTHELTDYSDNELPQ